MNKQTQMLLGVAAVGVAAYLIYQQTTKKSFVKMNATGLRAVPNSSCRCSPQGGMTLTTASGRKVYECCRQGVFAFSPGRVVENCSECNRPQGGSQTFGQENFVGDKKGVGFAGERKGGAAFAGEAKGIA